jgi:hypothetical protein
MFTYNDHNFTHLLVDVIEIGFLDSYSAFLFENKIQSVKIYWGKVQIH